MTLNSKHQNYKKNSHTFCVREYLHKCGPHLQHYKLDLFLYRRNAINRFNSYF